jgi:hypothetical protein
MTMVGAVLVSSAWLAIVGAVAAIGMTATVILLLDYLRLEKRALLLEEENQLLHRALRGLASGSPEGGQAAGHRTHIAGLLRLSASRAAA